MTKKFSVVVCAMLVLVSLSVSASSAMSLEEMLAERQAKKAAREAGVEQKADVKAEKAEVTFDVEDPSTWGKFTKNVRNVKGYSNGLVGTMTKTVHVKLPADTIIEAINTPSKTIKQGGQSIMMESGKDFTVWFSAAVVPGRKPNIQRESDARTIDIADKDSAKEFCVINYEGSNGVIITVDDTPVRVPAGPLPANIEKIIFPGQTFLGARKINGVEKPADVIEQDIVLYRGSSCSIYYVINSASNVKPDVNGQKASVTPKVDISKNFANLKNFGEFWDVSKSKGKGRVFMAHQPVAFTVPGWIAKVDLETGPVFGGKTVTLTAGQQCTFWGKKAINKR